MTDDKIVEQTTEIPAEFSGISEETYKELLGELPQDDTGESAPETQPIEEEEDQETPAEEVADAEEIPTEDEAEAAEQQPQKTVPYAALKEEREKRKERDRVLEEKERELAALRQQVAQYQAPQKPAQEPPPAQTAEDAAAQQQQYYEKLYEEAEKQFVQRYGRDPDEFSSRDITYLQLIANGIDADIRGRYAQQISEQRERMNYYRSFVAETQKAPEYMEVSQFAVERVKQLPPAAQQYIVDAYQRAEMGQATIEDITAVRNFWEASEALYKLQKQQSAKVEEEPAKEEPAPVTTSKVAKTAEKIDKMAKHPKAAAISANGATSAGLTIAEMERMLDEKDWGTIPPEIQKMLKGG